MTARERLVGAVLTGVVALNRGVTAAGRTPFAGIELTPNQLGLLFLLAHSREPLTPGAAATALHITPGAVTQLVDPLRAAGLVETLPHPGDRRSRILRLTDAERRRVGDFEKDVARRMLPRFAALDETELQTLAGLLDRVRTTP